MVPLEDDVEDIRGSVFSHLTVEYYGGKMEKKHRWVCRCVCGQIKVTETGHLLSGRSAHCGCLGGSYHKLYSRFQSILQRCYNENQINYHEYGGRGIKVCDRWNPSEGGSFQNFLNDMGECPEGMTIDRVDVNGDYCPENCKWETGSVQHFNTRKHKTNKSGRTGVSKTRSGKFSAYITIDSKTVGLGTFNTFEEAVTAREQAEIEKYGFLKHG